MSSQSGQVGIAVMLIMVVMSTIGISIAARTTQDIQTARQTQEAIQTFAAAESAVEDLLRRGQDFLAQNPSGQFTEIADAEVEYTIEAKSELDMTLLEGQVAEIDVRGALAGQEISIEWGETDNCEDLPASLIVAIVNENAGSFISRYEAHAICDNDDNFTIAGLPGSELTRQAFVTLQEGDVAVRITPIYNHTPVLVGGVGWSIPTQQFSITSVARNVLGRETKALSVERTIDSAPSILDFALVSGTTILK